MKLAVFGSRTLSLSNIEEYLPNGVTEIVSGGAKGIDSEAAKFAISHNIKLTEFLPDYERYGRGAPLKRNVQIVDYADAGLAFWDGVSRGTKYTIDLFHKCGKPITIVIVGRESKKLSFSVQS